MLSKSFTSERARREFAAMLTSGAEALFLAPSSHSCAATQEEHERDGERAAATEASIVAAVSLSLSELFFRGTAVLKQTNLNAKLQPEKARRHNFIFKPVRKACAEVAG